MTSTLVLLRHGQSEWNRLNLFTGWKDVDLSEQGIHEAQAAREALKKYHFNQVFCSTLKRAIKTAQIAVDNPSAAGFFFSEALNERRYGELEGQDKDAVKKLHGAEKFQLWRRSYDVAPPGGESLKDCEKRMVPYFENEIKPRLLAGETVLICAHGNSLRALVKHLLHINNDTITSLEIPTAEPWIFCFDEHFNLLSQQVIKRA